MALRKRTFIIGGIVIILAIAYLGYVGFKSSAVYYYTVGEVSDMKDDLNDKSFRINGYVAANSITQNTEEQSLEFVIVDLDESENLPVIYQGIVPDTFKEDMEVVIEGKLNSNGIFQANSILTKCPSKYEPQEY